MSFWRFRPQQANHLHELGHEVLPWGPRQLRGVEGGVMQLMKSMAQELAPKKIRVNSIAPGAVKTPMNQAAWETPGAEAELFKLIPEGRAGVPDDIARAAVWLVSDASDYVTGTTLFVDGGMTLSRVRDRRLRQESCRAAPGDPELPKTMHAFA